jgi:hypothetical protein
MKNFFWLDGVSKDQKIDWDNNSPLKTVSWDIKVEWLNSASLQTVSWNIKIERNNTGSLQTLSWNMKLGWDNSKSLKTTSWNIKVEWENSSNIITVSWNVIIWKNRWTTYTTSWNITVGENDWVIRTICWKIEVTKVWLHITIERMDKRMNIGNVVIKTKWNCSTIVSGVSGQNISIINGRVFINWKEQKWGWNDKNDKYIVHFGDFDIDFINKKIIKKGIAEDIPLGWINWDNIVFSLKWQEITISQDEVEVKG